MIETYCVGFDGGGAGQKVGGRELVDVVPVVELSLCAGSELRCFGGGRMDRGGHLACDLIGLCIPGGLDRGRMERWKIQDQVLLFNWVST